MSHWERGALVSDPGELVPTADDLAEASAFFRDMPEGADWTARLAELIAKTRAATNLERDEDAFYGSAGEDW